MYNNKVLDHFLDPRNTGEIIDADGIGLVGDPSCGDSLKVFIKVKDNRLQEVKYKIMGCPAAIATSSVMSELAVGKTLEEGLSLTDEDIVKELVELPKNKIHCSNLGATALHNAINDYLNNKNKQNKK
jgi:nitrogen fixation NifU-like protein